MREHQLLRLCARATLLLCLFGLMLTRLWAVLGENLSGRLIAPMALAAAALCLFCVVRFSVPQKLLTPFGAWQKNLLVFAPAFLLGACFDTSYAMFPADGLPVAVLPLRLLCHLGSGLVLGGIVLALVTAARAYGALPKTDARLLLGLALACNVLAALYVAGSATVYIWDAAGYWLSAGTLAGAPFGFAQIRQVLESVITLDYNYLLAWPISLVMRLFGTGRDVFVFTIVNLYLLPGVWGLCVLGRRAGRWGGLIPVLGLPMLLYTALVGFVDVAAAAAAIWVFVLYTDETRPAAARGILSGALLVLTFVLRRYFFFFAVSFGVAALVKKLATDRKNWTDWLALLVSSGVGALFFAQSFLVDKILSMRYGDIYSAYALGLRSDGMLFTRYFGAALLVLTLLAAVFLLLRRPARRGETLLALGQLVLCFFLFTRVQSHGQQHLLLYLPGIAVLLTRWVGELPQRGWRLPAAWAVAGCMAISPFAPRVQPASFTEMEHAPLLPSFSYHAPRRTDLMELVALHSYIDSLSAQEPKTAAIVASSFAFNGDTYYNLLPSLGIPEGEGPKTKMLYMSTVDKRDGFSWAVLDADYLVVTDPVQTHLGEENQQIMALLAHDLLDGTGPGAAFRPMDTRFTLAGDVQVYLYERTRPVTDEEYRSVSRRLTAAYPEYADLYRVPEGK
ncbi:MAG: hypothetical protein RRY65_05365 [Pseudoflavonifractor sp.]